MRLLKFEKEFCASCQKVDQFLSGYPHVEIKRVNPFDQPKLAVEYQIASVPVTILLNDEGKEMKRSVGYKPDELEKLMSVL